MFEIPQSISKLFESNPKVCLTPIETFTTKQAATKVNKAILFGKNSEIDSINLVQLIIDIEENLRKNIDSKILLLFWQFTIKTLDEVEIVANQNFSMEMFLIRLIHLKAISNTESIETNHKENNPSKKNFSEFSIKKKNDSINNNNAIKQIKNIVQEEKIKNKNEQDEKFHINKRSERSYFIFIKIF